MRSIISKKSPLRRYPARLPRSQVLLLDAMRFAIQTAEQAWTSLLEELRVLATSVKRGREVDQDVIATVLYVWAFVDSVDRLRGLLKSGSVFGDSLPEEARRFMAATEVLHDLRNHAQHIAPRVPKVVKDREPLWGTLKWAMWAGKQRKSCFSCSLIAGTPFVARPGRLTIPGICPDKPGAEPVELSAAGRTVRLDQTWHEVLAVEAFLEQFLEREYERVAPGETRSAPDLLFRGDLNVRELERLWKKGMRISMQVDLGSA